MQTISIAVPPALLDELKHRADRAGVVVEEFIPALLIDYFRRLKRIEGQFEGRGEEVTREQFRAILAKAPDVPPMPGDEID